MLVAIKVVLLQVVEEATCDGSDAFDVHLRRGELLFGMLYCILQIFQGENQLKQTVCVELERSSIIGTLWHVMCLIKNDYGIIVVDSVVWPH